MTTQVFEIPSSGGTSWLLFALVAPLLLLLALAATFFPRPLSVELMSDALAVRGSVYGRRMPLSSLKLDDARVVNLKQEPALAPRWRTNGVGLPNYRVGWFRLRNGERALCFLTREDHVLYLPTAEHFALLVSVSTPDALLSALQRTKAPE
jgi:hypothetical protein